MGNVLSPPGRLAADTVVVGSRRAALPTEYQDALAVEPLAAAAAIRCGGWTSLAPARRGAARIHRWLARAAGGCSRSPCPCRRPHSLCFAPGSSCANVIARYLHWTPWKSHRNGHPRQEALAERNLYTPSQPCSRPRMPRLPARFVYASRDFRPWRTGGAGRVLQRELPYREIHRLTGVSVTTTAGRAGPASGNGGYEVAVKRMSKESSPPWI